MPYDDIWPKAIPTPDPFQSLRTLEYQYSRSIEALHINSFENS